MNKTIKYISVTVAFIALCTSCDDFVFGNVNVDYNDNPLTSKSVPIAAQTVMWKNKKK